MFLNFKSLTLNPIAKSQLLSAVYHLFPLFKRQWASFAF